MIVFVDASAGSFLKWRESHMENNSPETDEEFAERKRKNAFRENSELARIEERRSAIA